MPKRRTAPPPIRTPVEYEQDGKTHRGTYEVRAGLITVSWAFGSKSAAPGSSPDVLAKLMLRELVQDAERNGLL